ncbi:50S ribosomal protein L13 [Candidatus Kaiserbacteria bacterium]|nr:50S ribosomal protein L13 [Candidatus Kaiserbacteria bacterium]MCB9811832.1 50S ribosomal protein L13 [Candidatus Nomurabacteria bacterium]
MTTDSQKTEYTIDAAGKRLGRVATEAASLLMGKNTPDFVRHQNPDVTVKIVNASKLDVREGKETDIYQSYSGYPGGRRVETLEHLAKRRGYAEVIKRTVKGMLPKNKLQKPMMHNLEVTE